MSRVSLSEAYRSVNIAALGLSAYLMAVPLLLRYLPAPFRECWSQKFLHRPCPLCGITRGMLALLRGDVAAACAWNVLTVPLALLLVIELAWRAMALKARIPAERLPLVVRVDAGVHLMALVFYAAYAVAFFLTT